MSRERPIKLVEGYCLIEAVLQNNSGLILAETVKQKEMYDLVLRAGHPTIGNGRTVILKEHFTAAPTERKDWIIVKVDDIVGWYGE